LVKVAVLAGPGQEVNVVRHQKVSHSSHLTGCDRPGSDSLECGTPLVGLEESQAGPGSVEGVVDEATLRRASWQSRASRFEG
jgi:hypothetical protein